MDIAVLLSQLVRGACQTGGGKGIVKPFDLEVIVGCCNMVTVIIENQIVL